MRERLIKFLATGFGVGYAPRAPGLFGSVAGVGYWWLLELVPNPLIYWMIYVLGFVVAVWVSDRATIVFGHKDPSVVVVDEIIAMPLALIGLGGVWWEVVAALVLFRVFDVWKPWVIHSLQNLPGGWGIVCDDLLAGLCTCGVCHALLWLIGTIPF